MKNLYLSPKPATSGLMDELESRGLIIRLAPGRHQIPTTEGEAIGKPVYPATNVCHGGHLLLACTIHQSGFQRFGWHEVPEEFLLIGDTSAQPLYLAIFLGTCDSLQQKIKADDLDAADFICLAFQANDPQTSFFTMNPRVPHGECIADPGKGPVNFYVTEPAETTLVQADWEGYNLVLNS